MSFSTARSRLFGETGTAAVVFLVIAALAWSGNTIVVRAVHEFAPPFAISFWRCLLTIVVLSPFIWKKLAEQRAIVLGHWKLICLFALLQFVIGQAFMYLALQTTTAVNAGLLNATQPAMSIAVAWIVIRERISALQLIGILLALLGVAVIVLRGDLATILTLGFVVGDLLMQVALLAWSFYGSLLKRAALALNPFVLLWSTCIPALVMFFPMWLAEMQFGGRFMAYNWESAAIVAYVGFFGTVIGMAAWSEGNLRLGPSRAASFLYLIPVFTVALAVLVLDESFKAFHWGGTVLVFAGVAIANRRRKIAA